VDIKNIKEVSIEFLSKTDLSEELKKLLDAFGQVQEAAAAARTGSDSKKVLVKLRIGTVLTFGLAGSASKGKWPKDYSKDDWLNLVNMVSGYAVNIDDQEYSALIFRMYADYIDVSANILSDRVPADTLDSIRCLAEELRDKTDLFHNDGIDEAEYTEECMWTCLDAMIKLLSATLTKYAGRDAGHLIEGISAISFEYGRLVLYRKEQELLTQYMEQQQVTDSKLQKKYESFLCELDEQAASFRNLIDNAFSKDFRRVLKGSIEFARAAGVDENEILSTKEKRDDFFLN